MYVLIFLLLSLLHFLRWMCFTGLNLVFARYDNIHIYECKYPSNLALLSTAVIPIPIWIFFYFVMLFLLCFSLFKFLILFFPHSLFCLHFYFVLHWRYTTKVRVTLFVLSNCFTHVFPIAVLSVTFWLFSALMAGNTVEQYRAAIGLFYGTVRTAKFSFFSFYLFNILQEFLQYFANSGTLLIRYCRQYILQVNYFMQVIFLLLLMSGNVETNPGPYAQT